MSLIIWYNIFLQGGTDLQNSDSPKNCNASLRPRATGKYLRIQLSNCKQKAVEKSRAYWYSFTPKSSSKTDSIISQALYWTYYSSVMKPVQNRQTNSKKLTVFLLISQSHCTKRCPPCPWSINLPEIIKYFFRLIRKFGAWWWIKDFAMYGSVNESRIWIS